MPEEWTGQLVGKMHNERITQGELANELGISKPYVSMILNGRRSPDGIRQRMEGAVGHLIDQKRAEQDSA